MWYATLLIVFMVFTAAVPADEIYTWTDSKGVTHISRNPPPPNTRHQEVIEYTPQTPSEIDAIRQERKALQDRYDMEATLQNARAARREAEEARQRAEAAPRGAQLRRGRADDEELQVKFVLNVWRQADTGSTGGFERHEVDEIDPDASMLEMLDVLNERIIATTSITASSPLGPPSARAISASRRSGFWM